MKLLFSLFFFEVLAQLTGEPPHKDKVLGSNPGPRAHRLLGLHRVSTRTIARDHEAFLQIVENTMDIKQAK